MPFDLLTFFIFFTYPSMYIDLHHTYIRMICNTWQYTTTKILVSVSPYLA